MLFIPCGLSFAARTGLALLLALPALAMPPKGASDQARSKKRLQAALMTPAPEPLRRPAREELVPGASLARSDCSGMDLRGLDLRGINLDDSDLVGANLTGADLTRASLCRTRMAGARLDRACLIQTNLADAVGLNLSGALIHPFFDTEPEESLKDIFKIYLLGDPSGIPTRLEMGSTGGLFLQEPGTDNLWIISPHGTTFKTRTARTAGAPQRALGRDGRNNLWAFLDTQIAVFPDTALYGGSWHLFREPEFFKGVTATAAGEGSALYASTPSHRDGAAALLVLSPLASSGKLLCNAFPMADYAFQSMAAMPGQAARMVLGVHPARDQITIVDLAHKRVEGLPLAQGSRPLRMAPGLPGKVWFLAPGANTVGLVESKGGDVGITHEFILPTVDKPDLRLRGLACAPDGTVWFTTQSPPALYQVNRDFVPKKWDLPDGQVPGEIVCGRDGRVFFTLVGRPMLGSFRPAGPLPVANEASSSWTLPPPSLLRAEHPRLTGKVRRERALNRSLPTVEEVDAGPVPSEEEKKELPLAPVEGKGEERPPESLPVKACAPGDAHEVLESLDLHLGEDRIAHILKRHSHGLPNGRGQFSAAASTREGLLALLSKGLLQAGEVGRVLKRFDPGGILHTPCWMDAPVGRYQSHGAWKETNCFDVVTLRVRLEDGTATQVVLSAYPVNPKKY